MLYKLKPYYVAPIFGGDDQIGKEIILNTRLIFSIEIYCKFQKRFDIDLGLKINGVKFKLFDCVYFREVETDPEKDDSKVDAMQEKALAYVKNEFNKILEIMEKENKD